MDNFKPRWAASFGISAAVHCVIFAGLGLILHFGPAEPPKKDIVEVDLVDMGGGGGGGSQEEGPKIETPEAEHPTAPPPEPEPVPDPEAENDVHEIREQTPVTSAQPQTTSQPSSVTPSGGTGSGSGSGGGSGDGTGTGIGPGTGSGSGGGNGSGNGPGNGDGSGEGDGETMGPQLLSAPEPHYPESARRSNVEGTAIIGLTISVDGGVASAWVESSSGNGSLDQAAVQAVYNWRFVPAKQNGVAIEVNSRVPVTFRLH